MNVNDVVELEITDNGMNGEGVARFGGKVVFVPYTLKGERVRAVIKSVKSKYATASVIKILEPSPARVAPACPHYFKCGGCDMGHVSAEYRESAIIGELKNNLKKIAGVEFSDIEFVRSDGNSCVRNKLSMPFGLVAGKVVSGLYRQNTHVVEPVACMLSSKRAHDVARTVCEFADAKKLSVYCEETGNGLLRHLVIRELGERMSVTLVINSQKAGAWKTELANALPDYVDLFVCPNTRKNNVIMGDAVTLVKGKPVLEVNVLGIKAELSPLSFFQVNDFIRDKLYERAIKHVGSQTLVELYSGIGITSNLAAKKCDKVFAVECLPQAVKNANGTAELNGNSDKIENICGDAEKVLPELAARCSGADVLVDPPRKGCGESVMRAIAGIEPNKLIYISCNHATMCRDIKIFTELSGGYELIECVAFDMFPYTHHVETLVVLSKKIPDSHINVEVEFGEGEGQFSLSKIKERAEARKPKEKVTYKMIQEYIEQTYGFKVHTAYIAEVKRDLGLPMYDAPNAVEELKRPRAHPTPKMVEAIKETLKHFEII